MEKQLQLKATVIVTEDKMSKYIWILLFFSSVSIAEPFYGEKLADENSAFLLSRNLQ
ncbi:Uncharacterised protein [Actinobacillus equuli]|nr:Uncharacterised protein [Actinobacillus equuli]